MFYLENASKETADYTRCIRLSKSRPSKYNIKINRETHIFHEHRVKQAKSSTIQAQPTVVTVH
jgi:hypothetical protein